MRTVLRHRRDPSRSRQLADDVVLEAHEAIQLLLEQALLIAARVDVLPAGRSVHPRAGRVR